MNNSVINTKRLVTSGTKQSYPSEIYTLSNIDCYIEKTDPKVAVMFGDENAFNTFFCSINAILDIKKTDLVIDQDGIEYRVGGVQKFTNPEIADHMELVMYQKHDE